MPRILRTTVLFGCLSVMAAAQEPARITSNAPTIQLTDRSAESGISFTYADGSSGQEYLVEFMGSGLALFDYDGDGLLDIYFPNGAALQGTTLETRPTNALYRNNGDGTFEDVTVWAGVGHTGYGLGAAAADYDNDGDTDLYVTNYGPNVLYRNNGDGTFEDVSPLLTGNDEDLFAAGAAFLDVNQDGCLDIYSANYVKFTYADHARLAPGAYPYPPAPSDYQPLPDMLYVSAGDGTFRNLSVESGIASVAGPSMGLTCGDFDEDGDTDIYVACDAAPSLFFRNDGTGVFGEEAVIAGVAFDAMGRANGMMGPEPGDIDNDGREDLFVTNYSGQYAVLFQNLGQFGFEDISRASAAGRDAMPHTNWGSGLMDFDNDGDRDLFISNGHMLKRAKRVEQFTDFRVANCLMANDGLGRFSNVTQQGGTGLQIMESSRGTGFDDMDNDGDIDCVILNCCGPANYLENQTARSFHHFQLRLIGTRHNRDGIGARVRVVSGDLVQVAEQRCGRGYQSHYGSRLHFGLGSRNQIDRVEVYWGQGDAQIVNNPPVDRVLTITQQ